MEALQPSPVYYVKRHAALFGKDIRSGKMDATVATANLACGGHLDVERYSNGNEIYLIPPGRPGRRRTAALEAILAIVRNTVVGTATAADRVVMPRVATLEFLLLTRTVLYTLSDKEDEEAHARHILDFMSARRREEGGGGGVWPEERRKAIVDAVYEMAWSSCERPPHGGDGGAVPLFDVIELCDKARQVERLLTL